MSMRTVRIFAHTCYRRNRVHVHFWDISRLDFPIEIIGLRITYVYASYRTLDLTLRIQDGTTFLPKGRFCPEYVVVHQLLCVHLNLLHLVPLMSYSLQQSPDALIIDNEIFLLRAAKHPTSCFATERTKTFCTQKKLY